MSATGRRPRFALTGILLMVLALVATACRAETSEGPAVQVHVTGDVGRRPVVQFEAPMQITEIETREVVRGEGAALAEGNAVMLSYLAFDATTGEMVEDSYGAEPRILLLNEDEAGTLYEDLIGRTEGSRLLRLEPGSVTRPDPVVIVYDILHTAANGEELTSPDGAPQVRLDADGAPTVTLPDGAPPTSLTIVPLVRGDGPQVQSGESVTVRYVQVAWSSGEVLESTWGTGALPVTIPLIDRIPGLQDGLVNATVGSRVLLVVPPALADGTDTMVFVVDVLAATSLSGSESESGVDG